jgi:hypothetical protein
MVVKIYKNSIDAGNFAGSGAFASGSISLSANKTVDSGNTVTYIVLVE